MSQPTTVAATASAPARRQLLPLLLTVAVVLALVAAGPIALPAGYHDFADRRALFGIPNAGDVLSNLPFLLVGLLGLLRVSPHRPASIAWNVFFSCVALTSMGSAYYHWAPSDVGLAVDRLPIAGACAALICAFVAERIAPSASRLPVMFGAVGLALLTVLYAHVSPAWFGPGGDLRPYLLLQIWPLVAIPLLLASHPAADEHALGNACWLWPLLLYLLAKGFEVADHQVLALSGLISGHTVKHLLAAAAALSLALAMSGPVRRS